MSLVEGAGDGNQTHMVSLEGCMHCAVRGRDMRSRPVMCVAEDHGLIEAPGYQGPAARWKAAT